jgi:CheY-like chemotaxis protein
MAEAESHVGKILVVDDETVVLDLLREILSLEGHEVRTANRPHDALRMIRQIEFDVVISDFRMPGMSGSEFFHKAQEIRPGIEKKFLFTSAEIQSQDTRRFVETTGVPIIPKPFRVDEVRVLVNSILGESEA